MANKLEKILLPLIVDLLTNKQSQSEVIENLHSEAFKLVQDDCNNNMEEFNDALINSLNLGRSLGILSITDTIVKVPFNFRRVTKPYKVRKNGSNKGVASKKVLSKRLGKKKQNITLKKTRKQRGSKRIDTAGTKRKNISKQVKKNSIAAIKSLWREMEGNSKSDVRQNLKMAFGLGKALGSLTCINAERSELPSTNISKGKGKAAKERPCGDKGSRSRARSKGPCERCMAFLRNRSRSRSHYIRSQQRARSQSKSRARLPTRTHSRSRSRLRTRLQSKSPQPQLGSGSKPKPKVKRLRTPGSKKGKTGPKK